MTRAVCSDLSGESPASPCCSCVNDRRGIVTGVLYIDDIGGPRRREIRLLTLTEDPELRVFQLLRRHAPDRFHTLALIALRELEGEVAVRHDLWPQT